MQRMFFWLLTQQLVQFSDPEKPLDRRHRRLQRVLRLLEQTSEGDWLLAVAPVSIKGGT